MQLYKIHTFYVVASSMEKAKESVKDWLPENYFSESISPVDYIAAEDGGTLILKERLGHLLREGWTPEHDDEHVNDEMVRAAICYLYFDSEGRFGDKASLDDQNVHLYWPWDMDWWKPKDRISNLVRAGALIAAEIDRLKRKENKP